MKAKTLIHKTIKEAAEYLLMQENYVDVYGRRVGLTYAAILKKLHADFPEGSKNWPGVKTSLRSLQMVAYALNGSQQQMPVRRRSTKVLARDYARALLLQPEGHSHKTISRMVRRKFPDYPSLTAGQIVGLAQHLAKQFKIPPRAADAIK
jgi:hypothetical protein